MSPVRLLAVTHETTLTGAPMNLLHLLTWIREHTDIDLHVLIVDDGPLRHRFEAISEVTVLDRASMWKALGLAERGLVHLGSSRAWHKLAATRLVPQLRHLEGFDIAYLNSLASLSVLPHLPPTRAVVSHVHELEVALRSWRPGPGRDAFMTRPDRWIAASGAVRHMLIDEVGLPAERVLLHHEFIPAQNIASRRPSLRDTEQRRRELRIPADAAIVMGAGTIDWRKGPDLFVQLAAEMRRRTREPVHFIWVGGDLGGIEMTRLQADIDRTGADHVHFIGTRPDPYPWFAMADVFALTSREDPYPLVVLEHAAMGHPIVTYRNGGIPELLDAAGPWAAQGIVDHLDVGALADRTLALLNSDHQRRLAADEVQAYVLAHHDVDVAAPKLVADITGLV